MKATLLRFECQLECPKCKHVIHADYDEVRDGGCYCIHCNEDFEIEENNQQRKER